MITLTVTIPYPDARPDQMEIEKKIEDFKSLTKIVPKAELENILLLNCTAKRALNTLSYEHVKVDMVSSSELLDNKDQNFSAKVSFGFKGCPVEEDKNEIIKIEAEFLLTYKLHSKEGFSIDDLKAFCSMNPLYNAWPYWRELVQSMANRMDTPVITIPLLKIRPPKVKKTGKEQKSSPV
jgi:hypothetical protein